MSFLVVMIGVGCKAKEQPNTQQTGSSSMAASSPMIQDENNFDSKLWKKQGVTITPAAVAAPDGKGKADMIKFEKKDATIFQQDKVPVKAGDTVSGSMYLWAKSPVTIMLSVARGCEDENYESEIQKITLTQTPVRYDVKHAFKMTHDCSRIQLISYGEAEIYAWGAKLGKE